MINLDKEQFTQVLKKAEEFHGHLGPFLVIGVKIGLFGFNTFLDDFSVEIRTKNCPPLSCIIDGIQISSGCTVGNGRLVIMFSEDTTVSVYFKAHGKVLRILLKKEINKNLVETCKNMDKVELKKISYKIIETPLDEMVYIK